MGNRTKHKSLGINAIMNGLDMLLSTIFPMITFPYISRVLGVENIGRYNFARSISQFCLILSTLGINTYAVREGSRYKFNRGEMERFASQLFSINLVMCVFSYIFLGIWLCVSAKLKENLTSILILSTTSVFTALGVTWIYQIFEEYQYIVTRNFIVKMSSLIMIFLFVRNKDDYIVYVLIAAFSTACMYIINFMHSGKFCTIKLTSALNLGVHFKPLILLASSSMASYVYTSSDIAMLGLLSNNYYVGIYATVENFYNLTKSVLLALLSVTVPRLAYYVGQKDQIQFRSLVGKVIEAMNTLMFPLMTIVFVMSDDIVMVLGGAEFAEASTALKILSFAIIFSMYAWIASTCILIPNKMEKHTLIGTILGASLNVLLNILLIPRYKANAAAFTTVLAELCVAVYCSHKGKRIMAFKYLNKSTMHNISAAFIVFIVLNLIKRINLNSFFRIGLAGITGFFLYFFIICLIDRSFLDKLCVKRTQL